MTLARRAAPRGNQVRHPGRRTQDGESIPVLICCTLLVCVEEGRQVRTRSWGPGSSMSCWGSGCGCGRTRWRVCSIPQDFGRRLTGGARRAGTWPPPGLHLPPAKPREESKARNSYKSIRGRSLWGPGTGDGYEEEWRKHEKSVGNGQG